MEGFKYWSFCVCTGLIVMSILSVLIPKDGVGRMMKTALSLFLLFSFLYPFQQGVDLSFPQFEAQLDTQEQIQVYEAATQQSVTQSLTEAGYPDCSVNTELNLTGDEIYIEKLSVSVPDTYSAEEVKSYLFNELGIAAEVYYLGE